MPVWEDFKSLPYINCIMKEGLRWHPLYDKHPLNWQIQKTDPFHRLPLGVPHRVAKDDWYEGMFIPKDASVVIPAYAIHRSEKFGYDDPDEFKPQRYLNHPRLASYYAGSPDFDNRDKSNLPSFVAGRLTYISFNITTDMEPAVVSARVYILQNELSGESLPSCCGLSTSNSPLIQSLERRSFLTQKRTKKGSCTGHYPMESCSNLVARRTLMSS